MRRQLGIFGVFLPSEITPDSVAQEARDFIRQLPPLRTSLQAWATATANRAAALVQQGTTTTQRDAARTDHQAAVTRRTQELGGALAVEILSPVSLVAADNWAYRNEVLLRLRIKGARLSFLDAGQKRRVRIVLNGALLNPPPRDWTATTDGIALTTSLGASRLRRGINTIECGVTNGNGSIKRTVCRFVFQPLPALTSPVDVDRTASKFGALLDGSERLVLANKGRGTVSLKGWKVINEHRDVFVFPDLTLARGEAVTLRSGPQRPVIGGSITLPSSGPSIPSVGPPQSPGAAGITGPGRPTPAAAPRTRTR